MTQRDAAENMKNPPRRLTVGEVSALKVGMRVSAYFWEAGIFVGVVTAREKAEIDVHFDSALDLMTFAADGGLVIEERHYLCGRS